MSCVSAPPPPSAIGVFDSGIGGLTVLRALLRHFPGESYVYIGDTARLPYGTKSPETVIRYAKSLTQALLTHPLKAIVIACNTASTHALETVRRMAAPLPVVGMIEPAARAAVKATRNSCVGVIATSGTVRSGAYDSALSLMNPEIRTVSAPCQMLVALAEEGWQTGKIAEAILRRYLDPLFAGPGESPDTLILGCTHFPVFGPLIREILGESVTLINSGEAAAESLQGILSPSPGDAAPCLRFFATDDPHRFAMNAAKFFDRPLAPDDITLIDVTAS